jgi:hypothetical protein
MRRPTHLLADASLHLATLAALVMLAAWKLGGAPEVPGLPFHPGHAATCRACASTRPETVAARDAYLVRSGCIEDPGQAD